MKYYLMIWDVKLASRGYDGCIFKIDIPVPVAKFFFELNALEYPVLSSLSFDDYDLFSGPEIDGLVDELLSTVRLNPLVSETVSSMVNLIANAKSLEKHVLFDPFRVG
ncbi:hypothetical protein ACILG0_06410 [Pseudomonadota bacterium AL_CKDN230030165-1A_HGKHYDSX7]